MREILLTTNHVYWLVGATVYVGMLTTPWLSLYPSWGTLRPDTTADHFTAPTQAATLFFLVATPTWMARRS